MVKRYSKEIKEEVLKKIRGGRRIAEVSKEHGIHEMTVRSWVTRGTVSGSSELLEVSRLRRENEALYRIIGQLTYESTVPKKNQRRERC